MKSFLTTVVSTWRHTHSCCCKIVKLKGLFRLQPWTSRGSPKALRLNREGLCLPTLTAESWEETTRWGCSRWRRRESDWSNRSFSGRVRDHRSGRYKRHPVWVTGLLNACCLLQTVFVAFNDPESWVVDLKPLWSDFIVRPPFHGRVVSHLWWFYYFLTVTCLRRPRRAVQQHLLVYSGLCHNTRNWALWLWDGWESQRLCLPYDSHGLFKVHRVGSGPRVRAADCKGSANDCLTLLKVHRDYVPHAWATRLLFSNWLR